MTHSSGVLSTSNNGSARRPGDAVRVVVPGGTVGAAPVLSVTQKLGASGQGKAGGSALNNTDAPASTIVQVLDLPVTLTGHTVTDHIGVPFDIEAMASLYSDGSILFRTDGEEICESEDHNEVALDAFMDFASKLDLGYASPIGVALLLNDCRVCDLCGVWFDSLDGGGSFNDHGAGWECGSCRKGGGS